MKTSEHEARQRTPMGSSRTRRLVIHAGLILFGFVMLYPLIWMLASSFKPTEYIFTDATLLPREVFLDNYLLGWDALQHSFTRYYVNSFIVTGGAIAGNLVACSLAAYAFARLDFPRKKLWFALMLGSIMLPLHVVIVPQYILFSQLDWVNTFWPLIVPKFLATDAFFIFLMVQFIRSLPKELEDAAVVDGCNHFQVFLRVVMPLCLPALATTAIFTFIWTWNDFFQQLVYLTQPRLYTVPLALNAFQDSTGESAWGPLFAMALLSLGPLIGFFIAAQRPLVRGIATTGLK
jgi:multiple sugar transport system permease protein